MSDMAQHPLSGLHVAGIDGLPISPVVPWMGAHLGVPGRLGSAPLYIQADVACAESRRVCGVVSMEIRQVPGCEVPHPIQYPQALFTTTEHIGPAGGHDGSSYTVAAAIDGLGQAADAQADRMIAPFACAIGRQPFPTACRTGGACRY